MSLDPILTLEEHVKLDLLQYDAKFCKRVQGKRGEYLRADSNRRRTEYRLIYNHLIDCDPCYDIFEEAEDFEPERN